ncbi:MAG: amidohydrolase family protein [Candidatus Latescibacterota bacterium]
MSTPRTDLQQHIDGLRICDTHEHTRAERVWVEQGPDILEALFGNYTPGDLLAAGLPAPALQRLRDPTDPDLEARLAPVRPFLERIRFTGYGEALATLAGLYRIHDWTRAELEAGQRQLREWRRPGQRHRLLHDVALLDHVQVDDGLRPCLPDPSGPEFFLCDLSWLELSSGELDVQALYAETGITVGDLPGLRRAIEATFERHAACAVAVKCNMAYRRTLRWQERWDAEAATALDCVLRQGREAALEARLCLGDWALARAAELAAVHRVPVKVHTGYLAGNWRIPDLDRLRPAHVSSLLLRYPETRFVLLHMGYPYTGETLALAKHFPNVWVDMCWAWSCDPQEARAFLRRFLHTVPHNKLLAFGGDTGWPTSTVAYALQARRWLGRALQDEVDEGLVTERQAMDLATGCLRRNHDACFDLEGTRAAIRAAANTTA